VGETWKPVVYLEHQASGSEEALIRSAIDALKEMLAEASRHERVEVSGSMLVLGTECGGSDGFSGITANPTLGVMSELVVALGGGLLLPEVPEMFGGEAILAARAVNGEVAQQVLELVRGYAAYAAKTGTHPAENPSLGNIREGLTTIQIKSLGAIQKAGNVPVTGVLEYAEPIPGAGLYLLNTPGYDISSTPALAASGANIIVFTTGLGTPCGNPVAPVLKVATNHRTAHRMGDIVDFNAGSVLDGEPLEAVGRRLYRLGLEVASGQKTANERLGHRESAFWNRQTML
jgi:altronate hydrolase